MVAALDGRFLPDAQNNLRLNEITRNAHGGSTTIDAIALAGVLRRRCLSEPRPILCRVKKSSHPPSTRGGVFRLNRGKSAAY